MTMTVPNRLLLDPGPTNRIPKERYTSREFFDLEMEKLWPRVWQVACREEEIPNAGDFLEYTIGDQSILVVRSDAGTIRAFFNTCPHRGTRLAADCGNFGNREIRCRYHAWRWDLNGSIREVVDRDDFPATMTDDDVALGAVRVGRWGGFVFVNMDPNCESLEEYLGDLPTLLAPYHFDQMRYRAYRTVVFEANWKHVVDSSNEGYHPQGTHPQLLAWLDDTGMAYRPVGRHTWMGADENHQRKIGPSPRLGMSDDDYDEVELLLVQVESMAGLWSREDRARINEIRKNGLPDGMRAIDVLDDLRISGLRNRGIDLSGMTKEQILDGGCFLFFPNLIGPGAVGNFTQYRCRPNGLRPDSTIMDMWALEWVAPGSEPPAYEKKFYADWREKDWGMVNNQDFANYLEINTGQKSRGLKDLMLNPVQEANLLHMHRVIDQYLTS